MNRRGYILTYALIGAESSKTPDSGAAASRAVCDPQRATPRTIKLHPVYTAVYGRTSSRRLSRGETRGIHKSRCNNLIDPRGNKRARARGELLNSSILSDLAVNRKMLSRREQQGGWKEGRKEGGKEGER